MYFTIYILTRIENGTDKVIKAQIKEIWFEVRGLTNFQVEVTDPNIVIFPFNFSFILKIKKEEKNSNNKNQTKTDFLEKKQLWHKNHTKWNNVQSFEKKAWLRTLQRSYTFNGQKHSLRDITQNMQHIAFVFPQNFICHIRFLRFSVYVIHTSNMQ